MESLSPKSEEENVQILRNETHEHWKIRYVALAGFSDLVSEI